MCRGTVRGSVPAHSTTSRSPDGKRTRRDVFPNRDGTSRPSQATCGCPITCPIVLRVPAEVRLPRRRVRDDELVERLFETLCSEPRREVAGDVVEPERRQQDDVALLGRLAEALVHDSRERLLPADVEVVRTDRDRRADRLRAYLQERPRRRCDRESPVEGLDQLGLVARVRDADLLSVARQLLELLAPPAHEPKRQPELASLLDDEPAGVAGRPQHRERAFSAHATRIRRWEWRRREFTYDVLLEDGGVLLADGAGAIDAPEAWKPDHFLVAALLKCTLQSLRYHADRAGLEASGRGEGRALVTKRAEDERYAVVEIVVSYDIALSRTRATKQSRSFSPRPSATASSARR